MTFFGSRFGSLLCKVLLEAGAVALSFYLAFLFRFDFDVPVGQIDTYVSVLPLLIGIRLAAAASMTRYRLRWRSTSLPDFISVSRVVLVGTVIFVTLVWLLHIPRPPRGVVLLETFLTLNFMMIMRIAMRVVWNHRPAFGHNRPGPVKRVLVVGAGFAGERIVREIRAENNANLQAVGYVDDDAGKIRKLIQGVPVLGTTDEIPKIVERHNIDQILIAIPSLGGTGISDIVRRCSETRADLTILPSLPQLISREVGTQMIRKVSVEDLMERSPVRVDLESIAGYTSKRRILVTGAGGSIGQEICRQLVGVNPAELILLDINENDLYWIDRELKKHPGLKYRLVIADIKDRDRIRDVFREFRPDVVFHAAAHKHVPLMEANPGEAVKNNVLGTLNLAQMAIENDVHSFVMISTDKAVNPTSVMGTTKRVAESIVQSFSQRIKEARQGRQVDTCGFNGVAPDRAVTRFTAVRFGNVLGSNGSVIPTMQKQIQQGGPVTVTHEEMVRFFMTIPEAVQLVIQAGGLGAGGEIFVLDMGNPVKIMDLAWNLIRLSGYVPNVDIPIQVTGIRPGEKLYEEVLTAEEGTDVTNHDKIFVARSSEVNHTALWDGIERLTSAAISGDPEKIRDNLQSLVPTYQRHYTVLSGGETGNNPAVNPD